MINIALILVTPNITIKQALMKLEETGQGILLLVDDAQKLISTVTDGDLRRLLLSGAPMDAHLKDFPNNPPKYIYETDAVDKAFKLMDTFSLDQIPVLDKNQVPCRLIHRRDLPRPVLLSTPHLGTFEEQYVQEAFQTNWIAPLGPNVDAFEHEIADYLNVPYAAALSSGTAALHVALRLIGVTHQDYVFCSSLTFVASASPILYQGAIPVFIDSEENSWNMSPQALEHAFEAAKQKKQLPKAVIVVNLCGQSADTDQIKALLENTDMVFIAAGMGGGTGTGAAPVIAQIAKEMGVLTVAVVTRPFHFEGKKRMEIAEQGIKELSQSADSLIIIPNNKLLTVLGKNMSLLNAFKTVNNVLHSAVEGIAKLITNPGLINLDFADVRTVMSETGMAMMGTGIASGENRAQMAAQAAIASPLLDFDEMMPGANLQGARGVLINITAGANMSIGEFEEVGNIIKEQLASENATVVVGTVFNPDMNDTDTLSVTIIVTGLERSQNTDSVATITTATETPSAKTDAPIDYKELERPAVLRKQASKQRNNSNISSGSQSSSDYLDIPAFLRRQEEVT